MQLCKKRSLIEKALINVMGELNMEKLTEDNNMLIACSIELGRYIAIRVGTLSGIQYSDNGIDWTTVTVPHGGRLSDITFSKSLVMFIITREGTEDNLLSSCDGINWTASTGPSMGLSIVFSEELGLFIRFDGTNNMQSSHNGKDWTEVKAADFELFAEEARMEECQYREKRQKRIKGEILKRSLLWRLGTSIKNYGEIKGIKYLIGVGYRLRGHRS